MIRSVGKIVGHEELLVLCRIARCKLNLLIENATNTVIKKHQCDCGCFQAHADSISRQLRGFWHLETMLVCWRKSSLRVISILLSCGFDFSTMITMLLMFVDAVTGSDYNIGD
jgi:hypothetical protein